MSVLSRLAYTREATVFLKTWPSANLAVATQDDMLPLINSDAQLTNDQRSVVTREAGIGPNAPIVTRTRVDGPMQLMASYTGLEFFLTAALGLEANRINGTKMPEELVASTVYRHLIEIDDSLAGIAWQAGEGFIAGIPPTGDGLIAGQQKIRRGTMSLVKSGAVWDTRSVMIDSLTLQAAQQGVSLRANVLGYNIDYMSTVNLALENLVCSPEQVIFNDATFDIRLATDSAFNDSTRLIDENELNGFQFTLSNGLRALTTRETSPNIEEPQRALEPVINGSFSSPRLNNIDLVEINQSSEELTARLQFTGEVISGTAQNFTLTFWFPSIYLTGVDTPTGPTRDIQSYSFIASVPDTMPTDFPASVVPGMLLIEIINTSADHPLL